MQFLEQNILSWKKFLQNFNVLESGSVPKRFEKSDSDPDKNRPYPQHYCVVCFIQQKLQCKSLINLSCIVKGRISFANYYTKYKDKVRAHITFTVL
jgi:hypothetical protein